MAFNVLCAAYGALVGDVDQANDVTVALQGQLNNNKLAKVKIDNSTMGGDPFPGHTKHFGAIVEVNGVPKAFACQENQTIHFLPS